jgi:hypothetical protein
MSRLESIRIQGLRSIQDSGEVELKPLNILVGTNSSGKSSFLRLFPLLRQSVEKRTRGPILWNGDFVDFESFENSISTALIKEGQSARIKLGFKFSIPSINRYAPSLKETGNILIAAQISIAKGKGQFTSFTDEYVITIDGDNIEFTFDEAGELKSVKSERVLWNLQSEDKTVKQIVKYQQAETDSLLPFLKTGRNSFYFNRTGSSKDVTSLLYKNITQVLHKISGSKSTDRMSSLADRFTYIRGDDIQKLSWLQRMKPTNKWVKTVCGWDTNNTDFQFLVGLGNLLFAIEQTQVINAKLSTIFRNVRYVAPIRTSIERYYRVQDLHIGELDHKGENLAMFISAIPKKWRESLNNWTSDNFEFLVSLKYSGSNIELEISYKNSSNFDNITDMGFGFSQILPIIVHLWSVSSGYDLESRKNVPRSAQFIFAMEQPELHLHPGMQARLADTFVKAVNLAKLNGITLNLFIETHSESLISKIGDLVATNMLTPEDVNVLVFNQNRTERKTEIKYSKFDADGSLIGWPTGFFAY